ncbi:MAG: trigger factor [Holosporaceae bacterium]|jgi:trigger factor|nr:trigger factor [Holosporaceae bacterium]
MKIIETAAEGLKKRFVFSISKEELETIEIAKQLEVTKKVHVDGFRPGKVPLDVVKQMYGASISSDAKQQAVRDACKEILASEKLASSHSVSIVKDDENGLQIELKFETLPSFELQDISTIEIVKRLVEIPEEEVHKTTEALRKEHTKWVVSEEDVKDGDMIFVDIEMQTFNKKLKGKVRKIKGMEIILGKTPLVDDFGRHFLGAKDGEVREFPVVYPENFQKKDIAGKTLTYRAVVKKVLSPTEYDLDEVFAKYLGFENLEDVQKFSKNVLEAKYAHMSRDVMKRELLEKMSLMYDFPVPQSMEEAENKVVQQQISEEAKRLNKEFSSDIEKECLKIAQSRVRLGFVVAEIAKKEKISVSNEELSKAISHIASMHPGQEKAIWDIYTQEDNIRIIVGPLLEEKVTDFLVSQIKVTEEMCTIEDIVALDEEPFDFFKDNPEQLSQGVHGND